MAVSLIHLAAIVSLSSFACGRPTVDVASVSPVQLSKRGTAFPQSRDVPFYGDPFWDWQDKKTMCQVSYDTPEKAAEVWWKTGAGTRLDVFISEHDPTDPDGWEPSTKETGSGTGQDWFKNIVKEVFGESGKMDCTSLSGGCQIPNDKCEDFVDNYKIQDWWIIKTVQKMHLTFMTLHNQYLQDAAIENTLAIPQIIKDFEVEEPDTTAMKIFGILGAAMSAAVPMLSAGSPASVAGGIFAGAFSTVGSSKPDDEKNEDTAKLSKVVSKFFTKSVKELENTLQNVLGNGNQKFLPTDARTEKWVYQTETAHFMAGGKWLVEDVGTYLNEYMRKATQQLKLSLVFHLLEKNPLALYILTNIDEKKCNDFAKREFKLGGKAQSAHWMTVQDTPGCYVLANKIQDDKLDNFSPVFMDAEKWKKLVDTGDDGYSLDVEHLYRGAAECAMLGEDTSSFFTKLRENPNALSRCQIKFTVYKAEIAHEDDEYSSTFYSAKEVKH